MIPKYLLDAAEDIDKALHAKGPERHLAVTRALGASCDALHRLVEDLEREGSKTAFVFKHMRALHEKKLDEYRDGFNDLLYRLKDFERSVLAAEGVPPRLIKNIVDDSQALALDPDTRIPEPKELADQLKHSTLISAVCEEKYRLESMKQSEDLLKRSGDVVLGSVTALANGSVDAVLIAAGLPSPMVITLLSGTWGVERMKRGFKGTG